MQKVGLHTPAGGEQRGLEAAARPGQAPRRPADGTPCGRTPTPWRAMTPRPGGRPIVPRNQDMVPGLCPGRGAAVGLARDDGGTAAGHSCGAGSGWRWGLGLGTSIPFRPLLPWPLRLGLGVAQRDRQGSPPAKSADGAAARAHGGRPPAVGSRPESKSGRTHYASLRVCANPYPASLSGETAAFSTLKPHPARIPHRALLSSDPATAQSPAFSVWPLRS